MLCSRAICGRVGSADMGLEDLLEEGAMARAYSADLRERVISVCNEEGLSVAEAARRYRLGERTVYRWRRIVRQEGRGRALLHRGGRQAVVTGREDVLRQLVVEANDATLADYAIAFGERTGRALSPSAMCRALQRLGLRRKKKGPARRRAGSTGGSSRARCLSS